MVLVQSSMSIPCSYFQTHHHHHHQRCSTQFRNRPSFNSQISAQLSSTAPKLFDEIPHSRDSYPWNTLIQTHLSNGDPHHALTIYKAMLLRGVRPDKHTFPRVVAASRLSGSFFCGKQIHGHAVKLRFGFDKYVTTALMELYGIHEGADAARRLFDQSSEKNLVSWTLMAGLYIIEDKPRLAIETFHHMVQLGVEEVDAVAMSTVISACGRLKSLQEGRKLHEIARKRELEFNTLVGNSLLKMYLDCGSIKDARLVFDRMRSKDVISWTILLGGYVKNGEFNEGLKLFRQMNSEGIKPDSFSVSSVLPACARISARKNGREIHAYTLRNGVDLNIAVENALLDMYMKSGCSESASKIFAQMRGKDTISWTIMVLGYSLHGQGRLGVELFEKMKDVGVRMDDTVYVAVLCACNTARMVDEGKSYFKFIRAPKIEHYSLMVSLLARAGLFDEARSFINKHQIEWHNEVQRALLGGCRIHHNATMAKRATERLIELEPLNAENYILLQNMYAASAKWDVVKNLRELIRDMALRPKKAYSWIEIRNKVHVFGVGDVSHPRSERIYYELQSLMDKMKEDEGYVPDRDFGFHDVDEERECIPIGHSELLAISFGLISTQPGTTLRLTKNSRVCHNCHTSAKMISKIIEREIILKDPDRFHHFKDGFCSCEDFW